MSARLMLFTTTLALFACPTLLQAQSKAAVAREMAEYVMRKFGKEAAGESVETLTSKIGTVVSKYGDDGLEAVKKIGPRSFRLIEEAGENGVESVRLMSKYGNDAIWVVGKRNRLAIFVKYGDDAAEAMIKHGEIAEPLVNKLGGPAAKALKNVDTQNARRLAMLDNSGELAAMGRTDELLQMIGKYGDASMDFVWRNKGSLAVASTLGVFLADPVPFITGARDLGESALTNVAQPLAHEIGKSVNWTLVIMTLTGVLSVAFLIKYRSKIKFRGLEGNR